MRIAIIGLGEVGRCFADPLHAAGHILSLYDMRPVAAAIDLATSWNLPLYERPNNELRGAEWVLSCVTGARAFEAVESVLPYVSRGVVIADFTTATPETKRRASQHASKHGVRYVDTAIMSAVSLRRERTPLLCAGDGAEQLAELLRGIGGQVRIIENGAPGEAASLKILRSIFTKGLEALAVEMLVSAEKQHVRDQLYEQLRDIDETPLRSFLETLVRTHVVHAERRLHEVHDAEQELVAQGLHSRVLAGVAERFQQTVDGLARCPLSKSEPSVDEALDWLIALAGRPDIDPENSTELSDFSR